jgi:hypothetical protein
MSIDASVTQITVTGSYVNFLGQPIAGQIQFTLSKMLRNSLANQMVVPSTVFVTLDSNGSFSTQLPATNDPDLIPVFEYTVEEAFPDGRTYTLTLPAASVGSLNLADVSPAPTLSETYIGLATEVPFAQLESNIAALDVLVNQSTNEFNLAGTYGYFPHAYATYTETNAAFATYTLMNAGPYPVSGSDLVAEVAQADAARISAQASAVTASNALSYRLNPLLLIGG